MKKRKWSTSITIKCKHCGSRLKLPHLIKSTTCKKCGCKLNLSKATQSGITIK